MARKVDPATLTTAEYVAPDTWGKDAGKLVTGKVIEANGSSAYVRWDDTPDAVERINIKKPGRVILK